MIYFDNAATTLIDPYVFASMAEYLVSHYGNPSSLHTAGRIMRDAIERAREQCAAVLNCDPEQIFFTSGATEANNWAMAMLHGYDLFISSIEHKSVMRSACVNPKIRVIGTGIVRLDDIYEVANNTTDTKAVSVMWVNNELGTQQPIHTLSELCYSKGYIFHTDATQAVGKVDIDLKEERGISLLSLSGHKIGAPKGVGLLFIRDPQAEYARPLMSGGGQEHGLRAGTENVAGIVALGTAMQRIYERTLDDVNRIHNHIDEMSSYLRTEIGMIPGIRFNGWSNMQLPHYLNVSFKGIEGESLLLALDRQGVCVSSGSACNSGSLEPSYVLKAIGVPEDYINGTIRISLSKDNTMRECAKFLKVLKGEVAKLRSISPNWKGSD